MKLTLVASLALDVGSITGLRAVTHCQQSFIRSLGRDELPLSRTMSALATVTASELVDSGLLAVAHTMADLLTEVALDLYSLRLSLLLRATSLSMTQLYIKS